MKIRKSFQFRLNPTKKQAKALQLQLDECRWLYNQFLEQRKTGWEERELCISKYDQIISLPSLKQKRNSLDSVHSQVLQNIADRLDKAFKAFFRRCKAGEKPGFPRFRGMHRYNSFCYPQSGFSVKEGMLKLSKIGSIRVKQHRSILGEIKTCTIRKNASGEWDVSLSCIVDTNPLSKNEKSVGIDVGIENFATLSEGASIPNPRFFRRSEKVLEKAQRKLSKLAKGTPERRKSGRTCAKIHQKIANQRKNFCHQESRKIIDQYQYICIEDLNVKNMIEGSFFAKSITDASWNQFRQYLTYKAEEAGRKIGLVNPAYTTQDCSKCGHREKKKLSERTHSCSACGYTAHRDLNAAQNILALGIDGLSVSSRSLRL